MGFFGVGVSTKTEAGKPSNEFLWANRCKVCTLNNVHNSHPKMPPTGSKNPVILFVGEAPGESEDIKGEQFVGASGQLLRPLIPQKFDEWIRWDNVCRCRPPSNRTPTELEIEACRPFHIEDVEATLPFAIFGFGNIPLQRSLGQSGVTKWRGRYAPIKVGKHTCWYFPFFHPSALLRQRKVSKAGRPLPSEDEFATQLDLKRAFELVEQLPEPIVHTEENARHGCSFVTGRQRNDLQELLKFLAYASTQKYAGLDFETQNLRPYEKTSRILSVAVSIGSETLSFPLDHPDDGWSSQHLELVRDAFVDFLNAPVSKVVHNLPFEMEWVAHYFGLDKLRSTRWEDTMSQAFVLDERTGCLNLDFLTIQYFGFSLKSLSHLNTKALHNEPLERVLEYNGMDAKYCLLLFYKQLDRIKKEKLVDAYEMHLRRIPTIVLTQIKGLPVDFEANKYLLKKYSDKIAAAALKVESDPDIIAFVQKLGREFKPGSPRDVEILLKDVIKTRIGLKDNGRYSTDEDVLEQLDNPIAKLVLEYRKASKAKSTYIDPYNPEDPNTVIHDDKLVHTSYNCCLTATGRLSSDSPNVQNQVKRNTELKEVRSQFIAESKE